MNNRQPNPQQIARFQKASQLKASGKLSEAADILDKLSELFPSDPYLLTELGDIALQQRQYAKAVRLFETSLRYAPDQALVYCNLGNARLALKQIPEAIHCFTQTIRLKADFSFAYYNRGNAYREQQQEQQAIADYQTAIALNRQFVPAYINCGLAQDTLKQFDAALNSYQMAIALNPSQANAHYNLGNTLQRCRQTQLALDSYAQAIKHQPHYVEAYYSMAIAHSELKDHTAALNCLETARKLNPHFDFLAGQHLHTRLTICDWHNLEQELTTIAKSIMAGKKTSMPLTALLVKDNPALHKIAAETWINCKHAPTQRQPVTLHKYSDKIRIGYFSADFRQHPVAFLTAELFAQHNRQRFEIIAFSLASEQDDITTRLKPHFDQFLDVSTLTDSDIAQLARDKHIDLAVDLGGHTADNRPGIFAQRAAPVQINYLGYAGTLGATYMDYLLADDIVIPPDQRQHYVEKIAYLPNSFFVNDSGRTVADKMFSRAELGLPEQGFVFCCFNNTVKLNPECFTSWMRILQQVPDSVLWLSAADPQAEQNLKNYAADKGIDPVRILFAQRLPAMADHLARLKQADLFLDTLPYNAHTTASDALWVGLPVLTCMGNAFAGRVAASLLTAIALPELICNDRKAYEASAIELAHNPAKLATIKQKLAKNRLTTPLFNTRQWTTDVESLYEKMLDRHKKGLAPEHLNS